MSDKKTAIVTGGSRGIGRAICLELASQGYYIIINYRSNDKAAAESLEMIKANNGSGEVMKFDIGNYEETQKSVQEIISKFNNIEILVNNAGITADALFMMLKREDWNSVINTMLNGFYNITKPVLKKMSKQRKGSVVSIASVFALTGSKGLSNYSAAKAAIIAASKSIASEVAGFGIRVNVVAPGLIDTDMIRDAQIDNLIEQIPMKRLGTPEEVAKIVRFLCSEDASYITGQVFSVNGGMY